VDGVSRTRRADLSLCRHVSLWVARYDSHLRDVAQFGSALVWGTRGRRFKSGRPDLVDDPVPPARAIDTPQRAATSDGRWLTVPNVLSGLRLATVPVFVGLFIAGRTNAAVIIYGCAAWTDFFDGLIARRLGQVSELGKFLDPLADRIFILALALMLVVRGTLVWWLALIVIARDVLVLAVYPMIGRRGLGKIPVNFTGKSATAFLLFGLTWLAVSATSVSWHHAAHEIGFALVIVGAVLYWVATCMYAKEVVARLQAAKAH
jgi:cardiolipin synthase (CMP-forming)